MAVKIQLRRGTAAEWTSANPILLSGEFALETDTKKIKIGNGSTAWTSLAYATQGEQGIQGLTGVGITSIIRTSGTGAAGTTDTYTITYTNASTTTFDVKNGADGASPTVTNIGTLINGAVAKTTPVDADMIGLMDSTASNILKKLSWLNIKATLKTYFDTLYNLYAHPTGDGNLHVPATGTVNDTKVLTAGATAGSAAWVAPTTVENVLTSTSAVNALSANQGKVLNDLVSTITDYQSVKAMIIALQSIANATVTTVALGGEDFDTNTMHDITTNNSRLVCKVAGKYLVYGQIVFLNNSVGIRYATIMKNGNVGLCSVQLAAMGATFVAPLSTVVSLSVNDYIDLRVYQDSGGALNLSATFGGTFLGMTRLE